LITSISKQSKNIKKLLILNKKKFKTFKNINCTVFSKPALPNGP